MNELLQLVLNDASARGDQAISLAATKSAAEFGPWSSVTDM